MTYQQMVRKSNTAGAWFVGSFMGEFIHDYSIWHDTENGKPEYIKRIHNEYGKAVDYEYASTQTKCYALMSIIENHMVLDAIDHVLNTNKEKVTEGAQENAACLLDSIVSGKVVLP